MVVQSNYRFIFGFFYPPLMTPNFTVTDTGFLLSEGGNTFVMEWIGEMLKVTGPDTCYYLVQTLNGLEQANCTLATFTLLIANN